MTQICELKDCYNWIRNCASHHMLRSCVEQATAPFPQWQSVYQSVLWTFVHESRNCVFELIPRT
jgi:hypothetical protein